MFKLIISIKKPEINIVFNRKNRKNLNALLAWVLETDGILKKSKFYIEMEGNEANVFTSLYETESRVTLILINIR